MLARSLAVTLAALALMLPARAQFDAQRQKAEDALAEYERFSTNRNPHVRQAAVEGLYSVDHYLVTEALLAALDDADPSVRKAAEVGLEGQRSQEGVNRLVKRVWLGTKKSERLAILRAFRKSTPHSVFTVAQDLCGKPDWDLRAAAAELLGYFPDEQEKAAGSLLPLLSDKEAIVRLAAVDAATMLGNPRLNEAALGLMKDSDWRVGAAAMKAAMKFRQKSAIPALIDVLKQANGRLVEDAGKALVDLTGAPLPAEADAWDEWWARNKDTFKVPTLEEIAAGKKKAEASMRGYAKAKHEYPPYHGIETKSRRMLFVVDISSSMAEKVTLDERKTKEMEEFKKRYGDSRVKIDIAREELINMVAGLQPYAKFNIITFNSEVQRWEKSLVSATLDNKNRAIKFLARLRPESLVAVGNSRVAGGTPGQTNTFGALEAAFDITSDKDLEKPSFKTEADTLFLLSDGNPTVGKIVEPQAFLDWVQMVNKKAKLVIHTISFGNANSALMEPIARASGGQFVRVGE
ncbi:MAG: HEAT repeat domain-containing protein [Planctomycetes bacterium]|nr:HEAT repeat domain-containing protein [Planctomycetota bacterium]MBI3848416.1 HEAT repeat domain-containing protein [Planctomycetota bacterium]